MMVLVGERIDVTQSEEPKRAERNDHKIFLGLKPSTTSLVYVDVNPGWILIMLIADRKCDLNFPTSALQIFFSLKLRASVITRQPAQNLATRLSQF